MGRPAKRQRISDPESEPESQEEVVFLPKHHINCTELHARNIDRQRGRQVRPTPTLNEHDLRRRAVLGGSSRDGRDRYLRKSQGAELVPRAPDTTVTASAIDINVESGASTVANTILIQATDATVVSFASIGVLTVTPGSASALITSESSTGTDTSPTGSASSSVPILSSSDTGSSLPPGITSSASLAPLNSTTVSTSEDITTTITLTSTLNVSFDSNGTAVTISNPSNSSTATSTGSITSSHSGHGTGIFGTGSVTSTNTLSATSGAGASGSNAAGASSTGTVGGGGISASGTVAAPTSSTTAASGGGGGSSPATPAVVGGAVGGVAGLALILLILLAVLRWYRKRLASRGQLPEQIAARSVTGGGPGAANQMSQRSSGIGFLAGAFGHFRPQSSATTATAPSTVPDSERGFQRIAGRKIVPILGPGGGGGDQYGGNYGAFEPEAAAAVGTGAAVPGSSTQPNRNLAESSFYRDSQGFYGGKGEEGGPGFIPPPPRNPARDARATGSRDFADNASSVYETPAEEASYAAMRPSPARTPVMTSPSASSVRLPIQQTPTMEPGAPPTPAIPPHLAPRRQDDVGRSLPSQDGSRGSRFTESV